MDQETAAALVGGDVGPDAGAIVNICFRVILCFAAGFACWIPGRLLYRNGEIAGTVMVISIAIQCFYFAINALVWHNDDVVNWPSGAGWCDLQVYTMLPLQTLNAACIFAIMYHLASQVSLMRATGLTSGEKRRKHIIQALIIYPAFIIQVPFTFFVTSNRYIITAYAGCSAAYSPVWPFMVVYLLPATIYSILAGVYAVLTWWRYRQIDVVSRRAMLNASNTSVQSRSARTKRKLYFMALTIVAPYVPLQLLYFVYDVVAYLPWTQSYSLTSLHQYYDEVLYLPSKLVPVPTMYTCFVAVAEVVIFFIYFGRTKEAHDMYRQYLCYIGMGKFFPHLKEEWFPSTTSGSTRKTWTSKISWGTRSSATRNDDTTLGSIDDKAPQVKLGSIGAPALMADIDAAREPVYDDLKLDVHETVTAVASDFITEPTAASPAKSSRFSFLARKKAAKSAETTQDVADEKTAEQSV